MNAYLLQHLGWCFRGLEPQYACAHCRLTVQLLRDLRVRGRWLCEDARVELMLRLIRSRHLVDGTATPQPLEPIRARPRRGRG